MKLDEIRDKRCKLENEIGRMIRAFETETSMYVSNISFGPVDVVPEGGIIGTTRIQPRSAYECMIQVCA